MWGCCIVAKNNACMCRQDEGEEDYMRCGNAMQMQHFTQAVRTPEQKPSAGAFQDLIQVTGNIQVLSL